MPLIGKQQPDAAGVPSEASMGFDALGLVLGSSIYHIGWQRVRTTKNEELQVISRAMYDARRLAIHRLEQEAAALDGDGIVGVRMKIKRCDWGPDLLEFLFTGTARAGRRQARAWPWLAGWPRRRWRSDCRFPQKARRHQTRC